MAVIDDNLSNGRQGIGAIVASFSEEASREVEAVEVDGANTLPEIISSDSDSKELISLFEICASEFIDEVKAGRYGSKDISPEIVEKIGPEFATLMSHFVTRHIKLERILIADRLKDVLSAMEEALSIPGPRKGMPQAAEGQVIDEPGESFSLKSESN